MRYTTPLNALLLFTAGCVGPDVNDAALDMVKEYEGWRAEIYKDPVNRITVGYGHLCKDATCSDVPYPIPLSESDGQKLLKTDIKDAQQCIYRVTKASVTLNANQYGSLVSWAFNFGCTKVKSSGLIKRLNDGDDANEVASQELPKWNKGSGGEVLPGLVKRRNAEVKLHLTPTTVGALPVGC